MKPFQSPMDALAERLGKSWNQLQMARGRAERKREELRSALKGIDSEDTSVVVFGSLGRDEFTDASDIDWTLLVDGGADPMHLELTREIDNKVKELASKTVGREGLFGTIAFSHELVHQIGGEDDTNRNTTRCILLLLESKVVGRNESYDRVITQIITRTSRNQTGFNAPSARNLKAKQKQKYP
jgi:predicted nucleotidyltransferase